MLFQHWQNFHISIEPLCVIIRSSRLEIIFKIDVFKNIANITRKKFVLDLLFTKLHARRWRKSCFPLKFAKFLKHVAQTCSVKKVFLEISQNSQENTCARVSFLIKLQVRPATLLKKRLWHRCFAVKFCKISKKTFSYRTPLLAASVSFPSIWDRTKISYFFTNFHIKISDFFLMRFLLVEKR